MHASRPDPTDPTVTLERPVAPLGDGPRPPAIVFQGRRWSSDEVAAHASGAAELARASLGARPRMIAVAMTNHPEAIALFLGLSALPYPLIVLSPDPREWRTAPPLPPGTPVFLPPQLAALAVAAAGMGLRPVTLPASRAARVPADFAILSAPGLVMFTSGSEGPPKPLYRALAKLRVAVATRFAALGAGPGAGVICSLPLWRGHGLNDGVLGTAGSGGHLALLERFDHRGVLEFFASEQYRSWSGTGVMVDALVRCPLARPCPAPPICSSLKVPARVSRAFQERFGVPLRGGYSSTESGPVTLDAAAAAAVRPETEGLPFPGTAVRIGDDGAAPLPAGQVGRIWVKTPWYMEGYGYPPDLEPVQAREGWLPTRDVGRVDEGGYLHFLGRMDDCVKTDAGHLVNLAEVAAVLASHPGVVEAHVVSLDSSAGPVLGAVVEAAGSLSVPEIRRHLGRHLPGWSHPRVIRIAERLPRLPGGKLDRRACRAVLEQAGATG